MCVCVWSATPRVVSGAKKRPTPLHPQSALQLMFWRRHTVVLCLLPSRHELQCTVVRTILTCPHHTVHHRHEQAVHKTLQQTINLHTPSGAAGHCRRGCSSPPTLPPTQLPQKPFSPSRSAPPPTNPPRGVNTPSAVHSPVPHVVETLTREVLSDPVVEVGVKLVDDRLVLDNRKQPEGRARAREGNGVESELCVLCSGCCLFDFARLRQWVERGWPSCVAGAVAADLGP